MKRKQHALSCHDKKNLTDRYPVLIQLKQAKDMLKVRKENYDK